MSELQDLTNKLIKFRNARNWKQFHNPKDLALSLVLESAEVLEHFQWKNGEELEQYAREHKQEIGEELADVLNYLLQIAHGLEIDIYDATVNKIQKNALKYPVEKSKNNKRKYTEL